MANWGDIFSGALGTGAQGAGAGLALGGPLGGAIGGGAGLLLGGFMGHQRGKAKDQQRKAMQDARAQMERLRQEQYARRMADLDKAMSYFGPTDRLMEDLYGKRMG